MECYNSLSLYALQLEYKHIKTRLKSGTPSNRTVKY